MRHEVRFNNCDCSPECCCCDDYAVYTDGKKVLTLDSKEIAEDMVKLFIKEDKLDGYKPGVIGR